MLRAGMRVGSATRASAKTRRTKPQQSPANCRPTCRRAAEMRRSRRGSAAWEDLGAAGAAGTPATGVSAGICRGEEVTAGLRDSHTWCAQAAVSARRRGRTGGRMLGQPSGSAAGQEDQRPKDRGTEWGPTSASWSPRRTGAHVRRPGTTLLEIPGSSEKAGKYGGVRWTHAHPGSHHGQRQLELRPPGIAFVRMPALELTRSVHSHHARQSNARGKRHEDGNGRSERSAALPASRKARTNWMGQGGVSRSAGGPSGQVAHGRAGTTGTGLPPGNVHPRLRGRGSRTAVERWIHLAFGAHRSRPP